jgi:hypothetical protein
MRKLFAIFSILAVVVATGCQDHRNDKQEQEDYSEGNAPSEIQRGSPGREMGGGGGSAQ